MNIVIPPVPSKYNMVNLHDTDLAEANGHRVPGLYDAIYDALDEEKIEVFYNWRFADIILPPAYVVIDDSTLGEFIINEEIRVTSDDTISIIGISRPPIINSLTVTVNGTYAAPLGVDGYSPVTVNVNQVLNELTVDQNGIYTPSSGVDGFSKVTVDVSPVLAELNVDANGEFTPEIGVDGFSKVTVAVPPPSLGVLNVTQNGIYTPSGVYGFSQVNVQVPGAVIHKGLADPSQAIGNEGDIYVKYTTGYIYSDATAYCDTGIAANSVFGLKFIFEPTRLAEQYQFYTSNSTSDDFALGAFRSLTVCYFRWRTIEKFRATTPSKVDLELKNGDILINGYGVNTYDSTLPIATSGNIGLFAEPGGTRKSACKIYSFITTDANGVKNHELIPYEVEGVPYFYDAITDTFINLVGTASFVSEPSVTNVYYKHNNTWVEMIGSNPNIY